MIDPIAAPVLELLTLFEGELAEVRFPDVDAGVLANAAAAVRAAAGEVERAEAALAAAKDELARQQEALLGCAQRAHAYGRVFAAGDATLSARLDALALPRPRRKPTRDPSSPAPRRGRPRKTSPSEIAVPSSLS